MLSHEIDSNFKQPSSASEEGLQNKLIDVKNFFDWTQKKQILTVIAVGTIFGALLPIIAIALPTAVIGIAAALTFFFVAKAIEYGYKGFKWSTEKTWEVQRYTAEKIKDGYKHSIDSLKNGTHLTTKKIKKRISGIAYSAADALYKVSGEVDYSDKVKRLTQDKIEKSDEIKNDIKKIFADKGNNTELINDILSGISSKIDLKIAEETKSGWTEHTSNWQAQKEFIRNLNEKSLHNLLTRRSLPKDDYLIDSIFSEHHSEIMEVIKEYKENHLYSSVSNMFNVVEKKAGRHSSRGLVKSLQSFSSLKRKKSSTKSEPSEIEKSSCSDFELFNKNDRFCASSSVQSDSTRRSNPSDSVLPEKSVLLEKVEKKSHDKDIIPTSKSGEMLETKVYNDTENKKQKFFRKALQKELKQEFTKLHISMDQLSVEPANLGVMHK
ncbi:MAG: hypothetical protein LKM44_01805 [Wolbachia endosymbiont of Meromenopon meropis]|nr:hypothetical protein [Wolbachia endosymbiont of Meromenopon meropis]